MMHKFTPLIGPVLALAFSFADAEIAHGSAEYLYGPETSQREACKLAEDKAKIVAIASIFGEAISNEEQQFCNATSGNQSANSCEFNRVTWTLIEGDIKAVKNLKRKVETRGDATACIVSLDADIVVPSKKPDPNFDVKVKTKQIIYRVGDDFSLEIESTEPAYVYIFNWLPNENNKVYRITKSGAEREPDSGFLAKTPNGKLGVSYTLVASWSDAYKDAKRFYDEWLIVIASKKPYKWLSYYDLDDFKEKLREIPIDERRIVRRGYQLAR
jgi:hypothetical protein